MQNLQQRSATVSVWAEEKSFIHPGLTRQTDERTTLLIPEREISLRWGRGGTSAASKLQI